MLESTSVGLTVLERSAADLKWTATTLTVGEVLSLAEIDIEIPVAELYEGVDLPASETGLAPPDSPGSLG